MISIDGGLNHTDITILIPTYNRAEGLRVTLEAMCLVERDNLSVVFVVIDNNSKDNTKEVVKSFNNRLPLSYLFEPRPGKNRALNKAIDEVELGEIVVFTDDDVTPEPSWLNQIFASCKRNPEYLIGGGKIISLWPGGKKPEWYPYAKGVDRVKSLNFGEEETLFKNGHLPWGCNFWIRRSLFDKGLRFDESIGPSSINRAMGSETSLLLLLAHKSYQMVYCPDSVVYHRLQESLATSKGIRQRAYAFGRGQARLKGFGFNELRREHRRLWQLRHVAAIGFTVIRLLIACMSLKNGRRVGSSLAPISDIAYHIELLKMDHHGKEGIISKWYDLKQAFRKNATPQTNKDI